jgi:hypothetical protein
MIKTMLHEIHTWFTENLKGSALGSQTAMQEQGTPSELDFELHEDSGTQFRLVCPHATVIGPVLSCLKASETQQALFACQCAIPPTDQILHKAGVAAFGCKSSPRGRASLRAAALRRVSCLLATFSIPSQLLHSCGRERKGLTAL